LLANGVLTTVLLMILALAIGFILSIFLTLCTYLHIKPLTWLINLYTFFIRGTPLLIQIFLIYYGSSQFIALRMSFWWVLFKHPFGCAVMALAINTSAYSVELFRGAINAIPKGETEACKTLGMSKLQMFSKVILPRAFRMALPAYSNEVIIIMKSTTLASTITLMDLMGVTNKLIAQTYETIPLLCVAGVVYLILNLIIIKSFKKMEGHFMKGWVRTT